MKKLLLISLLFLVFSCGEKEEKFDVSSPDFVHGQDLAKKFEFDKFGCGGENFKPSLKWKNAPKNTKSFVVMVYDPDAPTGSGWWHFAAYNISKDVKMTENMSFEDAKILANDAGFKGYMGPCPPKNHGRHHYVFTVFALDVDRLDLDVDASPALLGYMVNLHKIDSASIMGIYQR